MDRNEFKNYAEKILNDLPKTFLNKIDNILIQVEDYPDEETIKNINVDKYSLLGLYNGIPLSKRGIWYGTLPTIPDKIILFQKNIESKCANKNEILKRLEEVIIHELGHYFGMTELQIREAMKN